MDPNNIQVPVKVYYSDGDTLIPPKVETAAWFSQTLAAPCLMSALNFENSVRGAISAFERCVVLLQNQEEMIASLPNVAGVYHIQDAEFVHGNFAHSPYNMSHIYDAIDFFNSYKIARVTRPWRG